MNAWRPHIGRQLLFLECLDMCFPWCIENNSLINPKKKKERERENNSLYLKAHLMQ
jgi:hypothetical protein